MHGLVEDWYQRAKSLLQNHWKAIQYGSVGLAFLFIGVSLYSNWQELSSFHWELDPRWFALSMILVSLAVLSLAPLWTWSIRLLQERIGWNQGIRIWAVSQLAKYLPGGIWNYVSRTFQSEGVGVSRHHAVLSVVIEAILRIQAAIIVFLVSLPFWPSGYWSHLELLAITSVLLLGLVAVHPRVLNGCISLAMRLFRRPPIRIASLSYHHLLLLLLGHIMASLLSGLAFYGLVTSVHSLPADSALPIAGMLAISVVIGFLNPLTPHGLGTREGLLIILLSLYLPLPVAIVISLLSRLWLTAAELLGTLVISLMLRT